jgi:flagellar biogenesis protein FliO
MILSFVLAGASGQEASTAPGEATTRQNFPAPAPAAAEGRRIGESVSPRPTGAEAHRVGGQTGSVRDNTIQAIGALALVVVLIFALKFLLGRMSPQSKLFGKKAVIEVVARVSVLPRQHLLLVRLGNRLLLLGSGPGGLTALSEFKDADAAALTAEASKGGKA